MTFYKLKNSYNIIDIFTRSLLMLEINMDLEEVYLRQIDQKLKRQIELHEECNKLLKELLSHLLTKKI